ncbi:MAG TPA: SpoIIIAH-like family protein [Firmicutes bacterium]|nr:SpoIIIAH-like family protein [Bacillota bacterium]
MRKLKRNLVVVTVLFFVCAAAYLNWSYNNRWGEADTAMVEAEDAAMAEAEEEYLKSVSATGEEVSTGTSDYFAEARLTRQQSRDEALSLLEKAASSESASAEVIDSAMGEIAVMAQYTMNESQIENELIARDFADCVVFMGADSVTVAVPAPAEGLTEADVAKITDAVTSSSAYTVEQIKVIEVKDGADVPDAES